STTKRVGLRASPRVHRWSPSWLLSARPLPHWTADRYSAGKKIWRARRLPIDNRDSAFGPSDAAGTPIAEIGRRTTLHRIRRQIIAGWDTRQIHGNRCTR